MKSNQRIGLVLLCSSLVWLSCDLEVSNEASTNPDTDSYSDADTDTDSNSDSGSNADTDTGSDSDSGSHADTDTDSMTDSDSDECKDGCYVVVPSGTSDDANTIQAALDGLQDGDTLRLNGDFVIGSTLYLPSNFVWILTGSITLGDNVDEHLDIVGLVEGDVDTRKPTAITEKPGGATNIDMSGGIYDGNAENNQTPKRTVRLINFTRVSHSQFHDMTILNNTDDNFTLGPKSTYNECRDLIGRTSLGNGLTDKGDHNKWYDCIAEDCVSDGWTPKSRYSEFHRCIGRRNGGPGFGLYARLDGTSQDNNKGEIIEGNKFFACEAYDNDRGGISFDISSNCGEGAIIRNNFIQGVFYNNKMDGVLLRNKLANGIFENNEVDILVFGNKGLRADGTPSSIGGGLSIDGSPITGITGSVVGYENGGRDVNLNSATNSSITIYNSDDRSPAVLNKGNSTNTINEVSFSCSQPLDKWSMQAYCQ